MIDFRKALQNYPRLHNWYTIGPTQRAELEEFVNTILATQAVGVTADGVAVAPGTQVWVLDSNDQPSKTVVKPTEALTRYGDVPVYNSWSTEQALLNHLKQ